MNNLVEKQTVQMEFDNKNFEKNVSASISTLDKLKVGLSTLATGANGLAGMAMQIKGITFDPINNGVQMGVGKVMALTAALTGVVNITDALYNKVVSTVKALSVDQINAGFTKYEEKTASVQTIMSAVKKEGETDEEVMERVQEQLEKLNWFTDETSYNFTDMVNNIGKFTSQGVELDDAVTAMQGIATWAAKSGQGTAEASRAMYNLSQAMGVGSVQLMDWKSIVNANMATKEFKEQAMQAAVAMGTLRQEGDKFFAGDKEVSFTNFNQTLQYDWFTSDVLMKVLKTYGSYADMVHDIELGYNDLGKEFDTAAEAMEYMKEQGMETGNELAAAAFKAAQEAKTFTEAIEATKDAVSTAFLNIFENLFGNYLEAKELWTDFANLLYEAFASPIVAIAKLTRQWKDLGGREKALGAITRIIENLSSVFEKFSEVFTDVFGSIEDKLPIVQSITQKFDLMSIHFSNFTKQILENENIWENLTKLFKGIKRVLDFIKVSAGEIIEKVLKPAFTKLLPTGIDKLSDIIGMFGTFINEVANKAIQLNPVGKTIEYVTEKLNLLIDVIKDLLGVSGDFNAKAKIGDINKTLSSLAFDAAVDPLKKFKDAFGKVGEFIGKVALSISPLFSSIWNTVKSFFGFIVTLIKGIGPALNTAGSYIKKVLDKITAFLDAFVDEANAKDKNAFEMIAELIAGGIQYLMNKLKGVDLDRLNAWLDALEKIIRMVAEIIAIYQIMTDGSISLGANFELPFSGIFDSLSESLDKMAKAQKLEATAQLVKSLAYAVVGIAAALYLISQIDADKILASAEALAAMSVVFTIMVGALTTLMNSLVSTGGGKAGVLFGLISSFTGANIDSDPLSQRLKALSIFMLSIGGAILLLTIAMAKISKLNWKDALQGLAGVVSLMGSLIGVAYSLKGLDHAATLLVVSVALVILSAAVNVMASAVEKLGKTDKLIEGLVGMTDMLITFVGIMYALNGIKHIGTVMLAAVALLMIAKATQNITKAIAKLAKIPDTEKIVYAAAIIAAIMSYMLILIGLADALSNPTAIIVVAAAMVVISLAISNLAKVVEDIVKINNPELVTKTLLQLGGMATALIAFVGILMGLSSVLTNKTTKALDMSKVSALLIMAAVLEAMIFPIMAITNSLVALITTGASGNDIMSAASSIGIVFLAMGMIIAMASRVNASQVGGILGVALAIDLLAVAIIALTPAIKALGDVNVTSFAAVVGSISAIIFLLLEAMNLIGGLDTLLKIAGILDLLALSLLLISAAVTVLAAGVKLLVDEIIRIAEVKPEVWQNFLDNILKTLINWLSLFGPNLINTVDNLVMTILTNIVNRADKFVETAYTLINTILKAVIHALKENIPGLIEALDILLTVLEPFVFDKLIPFIEDVTEDITALALRLLNKYVPELNEHLAKVTWDLFIRILELLHKGVPMLNKELAEEGLDLIRWINWLLIEATKVIISGIINILTQLRDNVGEIIALTVEISLMILFGLLQGLIDSIPQLYEKLTELVGGLLDLLNEILDANWDDITATLEDLANKTIEVANKWVEKECEVGGKIYTIVGNLFKGLMKAAWYHTTHSKFNPIGFGAWIGDKMAEGICKSMKINSPSKVTEKLGGFIMQGLVNGVEKGETGLQTTLQDIASIFKVNFKKNFGSLGDITSQIGGGLLEGFNAKFNGFDFSSIMGDITNLNPVITPTLDLTELKNGALGIDSIFANNAISGFVDYNKFTGADSVTQQEGMNKMLEKMQNYMDIQAYNNAANTNINVVLDGDAKKMLNVLKVENNKQVKATGVNKLAT